MIDLKQELESGDKKALPRNQREPCKQKLVSARSIYSILGKIVD